MLFFSSVQDLILALCRMDGVYDEGSDFLLGTCSRVEKQEQNWGGLATEFLDCWTLLYRSHRKGNAWKETALKKFVVELLED